MAAISVTRESQALATGKDFASGLQAQTTAYT